MFFDLQTTLVVAVIFGAAVVRSAFGFGAALVAVPLLALLIPVTVAAPIAVLLSATVSAVILARDWHLVHLRSAGRLLLATLAGIPFGLLLLTRVPEVLVQAALATVVLAFAAWRLIAERSPGPPDPGLEAAAGTAPRVGRRTGWAFGFGAGVLGGAYGMNGPPLVAYGTLRGWSPERFRATLQGYYLPASLASLAGYVLSGVWTPAAGRYYALALLPVAGGILLGRWANRRMRPGAFRHYVYVFLLFVGGLLMAQSVT